MSNTMTGSKNKTTDEAKEEVQKHNNGDEVTVDQDGEEDKYSYRCSGCCAEFQFIDELIEHVRQSHMSSDGTVECTDCEVDFADLEDFLEHYRQTHQDVNEKSQERDTYDRIDQISVNQITILNEDGELDVGLGNSENQTDVEANLNDSTISNPQRKRRSITKLCEALYEPSPKKLPKVIHTQQPSVTTMARSREVEVDVSDINVVRLKTSKQDRHDELFQYLQRVDEKLDAIIKHFNVPCTTGTGNSVPLKSHRKSGFSSKYVGSDGLLSSSQDSRSSISRQGDLHFIATDTTQQEITQYIISDDLLEATFLKSRNRGNFAKNLVFAAFPREERLGRNCYGRRGGSLSGPKGALEAAKLDAVREAVFRKYPVEPNEDEEYIWKKEGVIAIDTALRSEMRARILKMNKV